MSESTVADVAQLLRQIYPREELTAREGVRRDLGHKMRNSKLAAQ